jgi:hypothetical protein
VNGCDQAHRVRGYADYQIAVHIGGYLRTGVASASYGVSLSFASGAPIYPPVSLRQTDHGVFCAV